MRILLVHPGAAWSTADVEAGLRYGLGRLGVEILRYRLDARLPLAKGALHIAWRQARRHDATLAKPTHEQAQYEAAWPALEPALRHRVEAVVIVSGMFFPLEAIKRLREAGLPVFVLFTETPYDLAAELQWAAAVDGCWTNERASLAAFRSVNARAGYVPAGWHPERHYAGARQADEAVPAHDVVFVGSGFPERITWLNAIDWTGIDLGLYGSWRGFGLKPEAEACVRSSTIHNGAASALYRRAKIGLNLYRTRGLARAPLAIVPESLSPRAYELARCGVFHLSEHRAEVSETFGDLVPTFTTPREAETLIRRWLGDDAGRARIAAALPACVAGASWTERATSIVGDLELFLGRRAA